ncbi:MAG: hypothetical protein JSR70_02895 [Proteobacteria bacterium]|nr:hypothetical protein [Pseudomonadota bacterium]
MRFRSFFLAPFMRWLGRLSHPKLFVIVGLLFLVDLAIPNFVPWDDILLGLGTLLLAKLKKKDPDAPQANDSKPPVEGTATRR